VVIVRRAATFSFLWGCTTNHHRIELGNNTHSTISYFARAAKKPTSKQWGLDALKEMSMRRISGASMMTILMIAIQLEEWGMFEDIARCLSSSHLDGVPPTFFESVRHRIEIAPGSFDRLKDGYESLPSAAYQWISLMSRSLAYAILSNPQLESRLSSLMVVAPPPSAASLAVPVRQWVCGVLRQALYDARSTILCEDDGKHVMKCVKAYCQSSDSIMYQRYVRCP